ncbi:MAG: glycoside hydrolase family 2 TIM barrel-domain containing protein [Bacteroidota bacterium]
MPRLFVFLFTVVCVLPGVVKADHETTIQNIGSRQKTSLNGLWQVIIDPLENGLYNHSLKERKNGYFKNKKMNSPDDLIEYDFDNSYQLNVPGDWNTQMEKLFFYEGTVWYKRSFSYHQKDKKKVLLYFEGVNYHCKVYLNGEYLGEHTGGFTPFQFDVSALLKAENFLILKVDNTRKRNAVPTINFDWWNYGGITRSVWLVDVPNTYVSDYSLSLKKGSTKIIEGFVQLKGERISGQNVRLSIGELKKALDLKTDIEGLARFEFEADVTLWSPENPKCYELYIDTDQESLKDLIGFKTIETKNTKIYLNDEPIFLRGISIHEEAPFGAGRVTSEEQCRILLQWAKELGCNFVRLAHYPHNEFMVREAEKLGLLVWSEIPVYWTILYNNQETFRNAESQLRSMIDRDKNRVGIGLWSVANETPVTDERLEFLRKLIRTARELDDTRLITAALNSQRGVNDEIIIDDPLGEYIDVIGINSYCGWYSKKPGQCSGIKWKNEFDKPMIMSEVGAGALQGLHGDENERWTEEYQVAVYENNIEMIKNIDFLNGLSPWILMDFRSPRRNLKQIQNHYNRKGLISETGIKKQAFYVLKEFYDELENEVYSNSKDKGTQGD